MADSSPAVRRDALDGFHLVDWRRTRPSRRQRDQAFDAIARCLSADPDVDVRLHAANVLTFWFDRRAVRALSAAASRAGEAVSVRAQAVEGVGNVLQCITAPDLRAEAIPLLLGWLRDPEPELRFWAIYAVGVIEAREARPILEELAARDEAMCPGWWRVGEEAQDVLSAWDLGEWPDRIPAHWLEANPAGA